MSIAAVFQIGSLGDSIVSVPTLLSLRDLLPDCTDYLLISRFDSNVKAMPSHVFKMAWKPKFEINYQAPNRGLKEFTSLASLVVQLLYYRPRYCVYLMPIERSQRQIDRDRLFFKIGGVKELIGFRSLSLTELTPRLEPQVTDTEAYLKFKRVWGDEAKLKFPQYSPAPLLEPGESAKRTVEKWLTKERRRPSRRLVAICPYSNASSKDIPDESIVELLPRLEDFANCEVVLLGGKKDSGRGQQLIQSSGVGINACGAFSVEESAALIAQCALAVCADSGPMHLAGALGVPCLVAFSRTNKQLSRWFPLGGKHSILYREPACSGCRSLK